MGPLFGINGMKIIKYLSDKGARELKEISEACMIHSNQVRKLLYQLMKMNIVRMLDITHKNDLNNLRTTTIWEFNFEYLKNNISELTYLTILNIIICFKLLQKKKMYYLKYHYLNFIWWNLF